MSLDFDKTLKKVDDLTFHMKAAQEERTERLNRMSEIIKDSLPEKVQEKLKRAQGRPFLWAGVVDGLGRRHGPSKPPDDFCVVSTDGSHIDVDRHIPAACALVNIGGCVLEYGDLADAHLFNYPQLYFGDELYLREPSTGTTEVPIEGSILGLKRMVEEVKALERLVRDIPKNLPTLALLDGSLVLWGLSGRGYPPFVEDEIIQNGLLPCLDSLREMVSYRTLTVAAYISLPRSTEVVNSLRLYLCSHETSECTGLCSHRRSPVTPCSLSNDLLDRDLFLGFLEPGERSGLFYTNSSVVRNYGQNRVFFYYLHTGEEIARIEVPEWTALNEELLSLGHTLILDQCRRGMGYPVALSESHEQAVISGPDRRAFRELLEISLASEGIPTFTSGKNRSKRLPWL